MMQFEGVEIPVTGFAAAFAFGDINADGLSDIILVDSRGDRVMAHLAEPSTAGPTTEPPLTQEEGERPDATTSTATTVIETSSGATFCFNESIYILGTMAAVVTLSNASC